MLKIENNNYSETPLEVAVSKVFLMSFINHIENWTIILGQNDSEIRTIILGQGEYIMKIHKYERLFVVDK